jgi:hypothetical protein
MNWFKKEKKRFYQKYKLYIEPNNIKEPKNPICNIIELTIDLTDYTEWILWHYISKSEVWFCLKDGKIIMVCANDKRTSYKFNSIELTYGYILNDIHKIIYYQDVILRGDRYHCSFRSHMYNISDKYNDTFFKNILTSIGIEYRKNDF